MKSSKKVIPTTTNYFYNKIIQHDNKDKDKEHNVIKINNHKIV